MEVYYKVIFVAVWVVIPYVHIVGCWLSLVVHIKYPISTCLADQSNAVVFTWPNIANHHVNSVPMVLFTR